ncbi:MAG: arginase family protein [Thermoanaerobaculia bacterium]
MTLHLLTAPTSLGNRPYESDGTARHTDRGPARLREHRVVERLDAHDLGDVAAAPYRDFIRPPGGVRNEDLVLEHVQRIARAIPRDGFTLVLGGDCSTLLGCLDALRPEGLVFIDGHTDFNTPATSETGGVAGMDLALVTGRGDTPLAHRTIDDDRVVTVGVRDGEVPFRRATTAGEVLAHLGDRDFFIHVDADALDPAFMPFVDSPEPGGLTPDELIALLTPLVSHPRARGMELTIYDPREDRDGRGAELLVTILEKSFGVRQRLVAAVASRSPHPRQLDAAAMESGD